MNFIKKIFDGQIDDSVHLQFQKFSKGEFRNRAMIRVKNRGGKSTINTSAEFANELVRVMAEKLGEQKAQITGAIVSTSDLTGELDFKEKKQFQGVKKYLIENEMSGTEILSLLDKLPKTFFALTFNVGEEKLKIMPKAPKSGKPTPDEKAKNKMANFCKLVTFDKEITKSFIFEDFEFKDAEINHTFMIDEVIIPDELAQEKDFSNVRELAKKKGKIIRNAVIDEQVFTEEKEFVA
jgi:hypothetical protein